MKFQYLFMALLVCSTALYSVYEEELKKAFNEHDQQEMRNLVEQHHANINYRYEDGRTLLFRAVAEEYPPEFIAFLFELGANPSIKSDDDTELFSLALQVANKNPATLLLLAQNPRVINHRDQFDNNLLHLAAVQGEINAEILDQLTRIFPSFINEQNNRGSTPLHQAAAAENIDNVRVLLSRGANPNITDQESHAPPLFYALENPELVEVLLEAGTDPNVTIVDEGGRSLSLFEYILTTTQNMATLRIFLNSPRLRLDRALLQQLLSRNIRHVQAILGEQSQDDEDSDDEESDKSIQELTAIITQLLNLGAQISELRPENIQTLQDILPLNFRTVLTQGCLLQQASSQSVPALIRLAIGQANVNLVQQLLPSVFLDDIIRQLSLLERTENTSVEYRTNLRSIQELLIQRAVQDNIRLTGMERHSHTPQERFHRLLATLLRDNPLYPVPFAQEVAHRLLHSHHSAIEPLHRDAFTLEVLFNEFLNNSFTYQTLFDRLTRTDLIQILLNNPIHFFDNIRTNRPEIASTIVQSLIESIIADYLFQNAQLANQQEILSIFSRFPFILDVLIQQNRVTDFITTLRSRNVDIAELMEQRINLSLLEREFNLTHNTVDIMVRIMQNPLSIQYIVNSLDSYSGQWRALLESTLMAYISSLIPQHSVLDFMRNDRVRQIINNNNLWQEFSNRALQFGDTQLAQEINRLALASIRLPSVAELFGFGRFGS